jgi:hypothetical protein
MFKVLMDESVTFADHVTLVGRKDKSAEHQVSWIGVICAKEVCMRLFPPVTVRGDLLFA